MKKLKPVHISILTIVVFVVALLIGMQSEWWILEGRMTPLDGNIRGGHDTEASEGFSITVKNVNNYWF